MTPFLQQVAHHYHPAPEISRMCFIFPNKRAIAFFRKYLSEECARTHRVMIAPETVTINDFFSRLSGLRSSDRLTSLLTLYECYRELNPAAEPLDEFIFWGGVILSDFAEVDKYLVEADHIFKNVAEFRQMQDDLEYLEPEQKKAMDHFLRQFSKDGDYKERFRRIWDILQPLYHSFNERLASQGLASEGALYRSIADRLDSEAVADMLQAAFPNSECFAFVGLNALNECEKKVLRKMRDAHLAEFCWDFSSSEIKDTANRSSFFLAQNVAEFPQAFRTDPDGLPRPVINVVSVPSSVGQAKLLPTILAAGCGHTPFGSSASPHPTIDFVDGPPASVPRVERPSGGMAAPAAGIETAIVLPDEGLLIPILNSIPEGVQDVNVTMGYPMQGSEFHALLKDIASLQQNIREKNGSVQFYHKYVWAIFSNSIIRSILDEAGQETVSRIRLEARYYIEQASFDGNEVLKMIFRPAEKPAEYLRELLLVIAPHLKNHEGMQMELDFAMYCYKAVTRLQGMDIRVQPRTWWRLFDQLTARTAVPFKGEPLKGMQIMGPLETRALDFDNVIILSCNEGVFPRRAVAPSFIPAELRKGFGLPTYEYQDSVWAYYFYRLIQRASNVWLIFDSRTELSRSGEESRYIRQLEMLYSLEVRRLVVKSPIKEAATEGPVPKTDEDIAVMDGEDFCLSASSLQQYLSCPAQFYFAKIKELKAADEVSEALDAGMLGSVLHESMEKLYKGKGSISAKMLDGMLADEAMLKEVIETRIKKKLRTDEVEGRNLVFEDLILQYVKQILRTDKVLLKGRQDFKVLGLELPCSKRIGGFNFIGYIDRLDSFEDGVIRVVDYKTGKVTDQDILIDDNNAQSVVDALFGQDNAKRPKIALQLYLYDEFLDGDALVAGKEVQNCIYQTTNIFIGPPKSVPRSAIFRDLMRERIPSLLNEIRDKDTPWRRTDDTTTCEYCDFKTICGR